MSPPSQNHQHGYRGTVTTDHGQESSLVVDRAETGVISSATMTTVLPRCPQQDENAMACWLRFLDFATAARTVTQVHPDWYRIWWCPRHHTHHGGDSNTNNNNNNMNQSSTGQTISGISATAQALWKDYFLRHGFSTQDLASTQTCNYQTDKWCCYLHACQYRRRLLQNLLQPTVARHSNDKTLFTGSSGGRNNNQHQWSCFNVPHRYFSFLPVTAEGWGLISDRCRQEEDILRHQAEPVVVVNDSDRIAEERHDGSLRSHQQQRFQPMPPPPPVDFECDCFVLTSTAVSAELLLLNPLSSVLTVHPNLRQVTIPRPVMVEQADVMMMMMMTRNVAERGFIDYEQMLWNEQDFYRSDLASSLAAQAEMTAPRTRQRQRIPPLERSATCTNPVDRDKEEYHVDITSLGVDTKVAVVCCLGCHDDNMSTRSGPVEEEYVIQSTMVAMCRSMYDSRWIGSTMPPCLELVAWFRPETSTGTTMISRKTPFADQHICRVSMDSYALDMCAVTRRFYVLPRAPLRSQRQEDRSWLGGGASEIYSFPMQPYNPIQDSNNNKDTSTTHVQYFPHPEFVLNVHQHVCSTFENHRGGGTDACTIASFAVSCTGEYVVACTTHHDLILWHVPVMIQSRSGQSQVTTTMTQPRLVTSIPIEAMLLDRFGRAVMQDDVDFIGLHNPQHEPIRSNQRILVPADSIHTPKHIPIHQAGFVTLHALSSFDEDHADGRPPAGLPLFQGGNHRLLLWLPNNNKNRNDAAVTIGKDDDVTRPCQDSDFLIQAMVNLPLSSRRIPRIYYDGRRLIVFGEDQIGLIILIYHVVRPGLEPIIAATSTRLPSSSTSTNCRSYAGESSGGVHYSNSGNNTNNNSSSIQQPCLVFANRIRHVALGGLSQHDSLHMTCNERFIIVNTKAGNFLFDLFQNEHHDDRCRRRRRHGRGNSVNDENDVNQYTDGLLIIDLHDDVEDDGLLVRNE